MALWCYFRKLKGGMTSIKSSSAHIKKITAISISTGIRQ